MKFSDQIKDILYYHPKTRKGILFLTILLFASYFLMFTNRHKGTHERNQFVGIEKLDSLVKINKTNQRPSDSTKIYIDPNITYPVKRESELVREDGFHPSFEMFSFDPNIISEDSLLILGFNRYAAQNLIKYREAGGHFRNFRDLQKIYAMDSTHLSAIKPYLEFPKSRTSTIRTDHNNIFEINTAEADELKQLKGIGPVLSKRIVKYRESLGGFYQLDQLKEVYQLTDSTYYAIKPNLTVHESNVKGMDLNKISFSELAGHPYIKFKDARIIINYRTQHNGFDSIPELFQIHAFDSSFVERILPYFNLP